MRRRSLSLLQLLGIASGVAALVGMTVSAKSALSSFEDAIEFLRGKATHLIERPAGPMDETLLASLVGDPAVEALSPVIDRRIRLQNGELIRILGIDPFQDRLIRPALFRAPFTGPAESRIQAPLAFLLDEKAVFLDAGLAKELKIEKEGEIQTSRGNLRVIDTFVNPSGEPLILMDIAHTQEFFDMRGKIDHVDLILNDEDGFRHRWEEGFRIQSNRERQDTFSAMIGAFRLNLEAMSLMALFVSIFLIYNTTMFAVANRRKDAGILRSLGATRREIVTAFLAEILIFGVIGGIIGSALGYLLSRFLTAVIGSTISNLYFFLRPTPLPWSAWILALGIAIGCGASLLGSILPLTELSRQNPVETLQGRTASRSSRKSAVKAAYAGAAVILLSIVILAVTTRHIYAAFLAVFGFLFGLSLFTGLVIIILTPALRWCLGKGGGLAGKVAAGNIRRNLGRTGVAVAAFMVALAMSVGISAMIGSFRESLVWWMGSQLRGDLYISNVSETEVPLDLYHEIRAVPGIGGVDAYRKVQTSYRDRTMFIAAVDASVLRRFARFAWVAGGDEHWEGVKKGGVIISESFARNFSVEPGSVIDLEGVKGPVGLRVEAVFYDYSAEHGLVMMDRQTYIRLFDDRTINSVAVFIDPGNPEKEAILSKVKKMAVARNLPVYTQKQLHGNILGVFDSTFAVTRSMRIMAIIIAFFGIMGALITLFIERRRDFGILRALGFSTGQVSSMTLLEAVGMGLVSFILASFAGPVLAFLLIKVINLRSFNWTIFYYFQWQPYFFAAVTAFLASVGAALYPIWKVRRTYPQMQIREE
jgi:putative ABC transport system permease protein